MAKSPKSAKRVAEERRDAGARASARYLDLQLDFVDEDTGKRIGRFGGRWDRVERRYVGNASRRRVMRMHAGQVEPARFFDSWLGDHLSDERREPRIYDCALTGGRRGGKSQLGFGCVVAYALAVPGSIVWCVAPSDAFFGEVLYYLEEVMPREWYSSLGWPHWVYYLPNGSQIVVRSGHTPRRLKQGRADFIFVNEGQAVPNQSYQTMSASIVDWGGMIMSASNPPDVGDPGTWVLDLAVEASRGERKHAVHYFLDPLLNPHIDRAALEALAEKYDEHTFNVQVRGMFLNYPDTVLHSWNRKDNEQPTPQLPGLDCTREFTKHFEGREYDHVVGIDVQNYPWIAAVVVKAFRNPVAPNDMTKAYLWAVGEAFTEQGDELACAAQLVDLGLKEERTLVVIDASAEWQQQERDERKQRPMFKGAGAMDMFRAAGFRHVVPPDPDMNANPKIADRCRAANSRIGTKAGTRYVFADPKRCTKTVGSIRDWRRSKSTGQPSRFMKAAHGGDAITYVIWRFFPRRIETTNVDVQTFKRFKGEARTRGFT